MPPRSIRMLLVVLIPALGPVAPISSAPPSSPAARTTMTEAAALPPASAWRRTSQGWQRTSSWPVRASSTKVPPVANVHPLVLAALIGLLSLGALIGFGPSPRMWR